MTSTVEVLQKARALIEKPRRWTRHTFARTRWLRLPTRDRGCKAYAFCAFGAVSRAGMACGSVSGEASAYGALLCVMGPSIVKFNDTHTHAEVLAAFDKAIELASNTESLSNSEGA
jgi:hypothetical protein